MNIEREDTMFRTPCGKCTDGFISAFRHIEAGRRFACQGRGYIMVKTDPKILAARRAKRAEKKQVDHDAQRAAYEAHTEAIADLYKTDDRVGPKTRARCAKHPMAADEVNRMIAKMNAGPFPDFWLRNLAD